MFPLSGTIQRQSNPILAEGLVQTGWIGFPTSDAAGAYAGNLSPAHTLDQGKAAVGGAISSVDDFLSRLTDPKLWIRVAEVVVGLILIAVGIAKLTNTVPIATKVAKLAGTAAIL